MMRVALELVRRALHELILDLAHRAAVRKT